MPPALQYRDFRLFWGGLVLSAIGGQFNTVATMWQIYELTDSALQIGLLGLTRGVPQLIFILFGGLLADAIDRRRLMMGCLATQFGVSISLVAFTATDHISPAVLYVAAVFQAVSSSLAQPSRDAIIPNLVPREHLASAVALNSMQRTVGSVAGPAIAGVVLAFAGAAWCYAVDASSYIAMAGALLMVRKTQAAPGGGRRAVSLGALKEGITFVRTNPILLSLMVLDFNATFFGNQRALFPVYARDILDVGAAGLGVMNSAVAIGALLGALIVNRLPGRDYAGRWVMILMTCFGLCTCGFAFSTNFFLTLALLGGVGLTNSAATILRNTINQLVTPDQLRGRVLAVNHVFTSGGPQFGQFESGAVAATWGPEVSAFTGGLAAALIVPMLVFVRPIREFRMRRAEADASAARDTAGVR